MSDEKNEKKGFKVEDKRRFTEDGESAGPKTPTEEQSKIAEEQYETCSEEKSSEAKAKNRQPMEVDFTMFVVSLSSSAFMSMGLLADPTTGKKEVNLPAAKQTIDIISMLQKKTEGNLSDDEQGLLSRVLFDLRMNFVSHCGGK